MGKSDREHYYFIDYLRATACYLVVLHHCIGYFPEASGAIFYIRYVKVFFPTVTLYLLVSGFVHASVIANKPQAYGDYVWEKVRRIMIPYLCVSVITMGLRVVIERNHLMPLDEIQYTPFLWGRAGLRLLFSGVEGHYYFLEILFAYLLLFPFLVRRITSQRAALLSLVFLWGIDPFLARLCQHLYSSAWSPTTLFIALIAGFKFFFFGFALNKCYSTLKPLLVRWGIWWGVASLIAFVLLHHWWPAGAEHWVFLQLFGYFAIARAVFYRPHVWVNRIAELSFGVYLLHQPYFIKSSRLILGPLVNYPNVQFVSTWLLTAVLATLSVRILSANEFVSRMLFGKTQGRMRSKKEKKTRAVSSPRLTV